MNAANESYAKPIILRQTFLLSFYFFHIVLQVLNADGYVVDESGCFVSVEEPSAELSVTRSASKLALFTVLPEFTLQLAKTTVIREGERLALVCRLNGDCEPRPAILWFRDGQLLKEGQGLNTTIQFDAGTCECRLLIDSCEKFLNQGIYTCTAAVRTSPSEPFEFVCKTLTNVKIVSSERVGEEATAGAYESGSEAEGRPAGHGIAPMFLQSLEDVELEEGDEMELKCQIMGAPIPEVAAFFAKNITEKTAIKRVRSELLDYNYETGIFKISIRNVSNEGT